MKQGIRKQLSFRAVKREYLHPERLITISEKMFIFLVSSITGNRISGVYPGTDATSHIIYL